MIWQQFHRTINNVFSKPATKIALGIGLMAIAPSLALGEPTAQLFGTTSEAGQIGHDYMVMQVSEENAVKGAFYQVNSEYACFSGEIDQGKLNLAVIDPYEQVAYQHQLNYEATSLVASAGEQPQPQIVPEGFQLIKAVSNLANAILAECVTGTPLDI